MSGVRVERKAYDFVPEGRSLRPLRDQIIVRVLPLKLSERIIATWSGSAVRGEVIAVGPGTYPNVHTKGHRDGKDTRSVRPSVRFRPTEVRVGDIVHLGGMEINGYLFPKVYIGHDEHVIATEKDVCGVETGEN